MLEHAVAADPVAVPLLEKFTAVEVGDSTTVTVPDDYAAEFPGCGGKADSGKAAVKIPTAWDLRTGKLTKLEVQPGRHSDAKSEAAEAPVRRGSLLIRDLGYFCLKRFQRWDAEGAFWTRAGNTARRSSTRTDSRWSCWNTCGSTRGAAPSTGRSCWVPRTCPVG